VNSLFSDQGFLSLEKREFTSLTPIFLIREIRGYFPPNWVSIGHVF